MSQKKTVFNTRYIAGVAILSAIAFVLQYIEISIPIMPFFLKFDFSDLPAVLGAFAYGPLAGVIIELLKNLIHMPFSNSQFVGEISNFLLGAVFVLVTGLIYKSKKTKKNAIVGGTIGSVVMAVISIPSNFFFVYPLYNVIYFQGIYSFKSEDMPAIISVYQALLPQSDTLIKSLLIFNLPFTLVKGLICVIITMLIYKPLSPILHGRNK